jgi:hypothetical protein
VTLLLDTAPEVALSRKDDVPHVDYLIERRAWYLRLQDRPEVRLFDSQVPPDALLHAILSGGALAIMGEAG